MDLLYDFISSAAFLVENGDSSEISCGWNADAGTHLGSYKFIYPTISFAVTGTTFSESATQSAGTQTFREFGVASDEIVTHVILNSFDIKRNDRRFLGDGDVAESVAINIVSPSSGNIVSGGLYSDVITITTSWVTVSPATTGDVIAGLQGVNEEVRFNLAYTVSGFNGSLIASSGSTAFPYLPSPEGGDAIGVSGTVDYTGVEIDNISLTLVIAAASGTTPPVDPGKPAISITGAPRSQLTYAGSYGLDLDVCHPYRGARKIRNFLTGERSSLLDIKLIQAYSDDAEAELLPGIASYEYVEDSVISSIQHSRYQIEWRTGRW